VPPNNSLQLTRLACGELERDLPARMRENEGSVAWAAGQLSSRPLGGSTVGLPWRSNECLPSTIQGLASFPTE
jgi:hypothetical protein